MYTWLLILTIIMPNGITTQQIQMKTESTCRYWEIYYNKLRINKELNNIGRGIPILYTAQCINI